MNNLRDSIETKQEEKLLILCSRTELSSDEEVEIKEILNRDMDITRLIGLAVKHKVLPLISKHILNLSENTNLSFQYKRLFLFSYLGNKQRNEVLFNELFNILNHFYNEKIDIIPLKGLVLTPLVYKDYGIRTLNDLDFLISINSKSIVSSELKKLGYKMGKYDYFATQFTEITREEELLWKMHLGNLHPHVKKGPNDYLNYINVDFSYDVDLKKEYTASRLLIENSIDSEILGVRTKMLNEIDFLIHICIHLYKEATNVEWVYLHAELNLIKFCDLREYTLSIVDKLDWTELSVRAKELGADDAVFYSYYYLDFIYGERFTDNFTRQLGITDISYMEKYGEKDYQGAKVWKKSFTERFFSLSNKDEITEISKYQLSQVKD